MSTEASNSAAPSGTPAIKSRRAALVAGALAVGLLGSGALVWQSTNAAFTGSTSPGVNNWSAGQVSITTSAGGTALFNATGLVPGSSGSKCVTVTYGGDVAAVVRLYSASATGSLNDYVNLTISNGTGSAADCSDFTGTQFYSGTATNFNSTSSSYANGLGTWNPTANGQTRTYKFAYDIDASTPNAQQGANGTLGFTWEARTS
jgi:hypothetical protein